MTNADPTTQELLESLKAHTGEARLRYARANTDALLKSLPKAADLLTHMTDSDVFEPCFDQPAYSSFVVDLTTRLVQQYRAAGFRDLRMPIEDCLWAIANSQRESDEFVDFCNGFGNAIAEFILGVDSNNVSNVVLPMGDTLLKNEKNPGIQVLRTIIAKALVRRCG
jgi:hypothetical protein